jgi:multidrug efflux pump subunit AcrB
MFLALQLPDGASAQRTDAAEQKITDALLKTDGVQGVIAVNDFSLLTQVQSTNAGFFFVPSNHGRCARASRSSLNTSRAICRSSSWPIPTALPSPFRRHRFPASEPPAA